MKDAEVAVRSDINRRVVEVVLRAAQRDGASRIAAMVSLLDARDRVLDERDARIGELELLVNRLATAIHETITVLSRLSQDVESAQGELAQQLADLVRT